MLLITLTILFLQISGTDQQPFSYHDTGQDVEFTCQGSGSNSFYPLLKKIVCLRGDPACQATVYDAFGDDAGPDYTGRVEYDTNQPLKITLKSVMLNDAGHYECAGIDVQSSDIYIAIADLPVIQNVNTGALTVNTESSQVVCIVNYITGNPSVKWMLDNTELPVNEVTTVSTSNVEITLTSTLTHQYVRSDNGKTLTCALITDTTGSTVWSQTSATLDVQYKPYDITISVSPTVVRENEDVTLTCSPAGGRPNVYTYQWLYGGSQIPNSSSNILIRDNIQRTHTGSYRCVVVNAVGSAEKTVEIDVQYLDVSVNPSSATKKRGESLTLVCVTAANPSTVSFGWKFGASVLSPVSRNLVLNSLVPSNTGTYTCTANNGIFETASANVVVQFLDISISPLSLTKDAGESISLTCDTNGVPPVNSYSWKLDSQTLTDNTQTLQRTNVQPGNAGTYTCTANNGAFIVMSSAQVVVRYLVVSVSPQTSTKNEGESVTLTCNANGVPTAYTYSWKHDNQPLPATSSSLQITNLDASDAGGYTCTTYNGQFTKSASANVVVQYLTVSITPTTETKKAGESFTLTCNADGIPSVSSYVWTHDSQPLAATSRTLQVTDLKSEDAGNYKCTAGNVVFTENASATIVVQYLDVFITPSSVTKTEGESLILTCTTTGVPAEITSYTWKLGNQQLTSTSSTLELNDLKYAHAGTYTCSANNGVFTTVNSAVVTVQFAPILDPIHYSNNMTDPQGAAVKDNVTFILYVLAVPNPQSFVWKKVNTDTLDSKNQIIDDVLSSSLTVVDVTEGDFGNYSCEVNNGIKTPTIFLFELKPAGSPTCPSGVNTTNITAVSATVVWTPEFDGGRQQTFTLSFKRKIETMWTSMTYTNNQHPDQSQKISGLADNTEYEYKLITTNELGQCETRVFTFKTNAKPVLPSKTDINILTDGNRVRLTWPLIKGEFTHLVIRYCKEGSQTECKEVEVKATETSKEVTIEEGTQYQYQLLVYDGEDKVAESDKLSSQGNFPATEVIIGVVVAVVFFICIIGIIVFVIMKRRGSLNKKSDVEMHGSHLVNGDTIESNGILNLAAELEDDNDVDDPRYACATDLKKAQNKTPDTTDPKTVAESQTASVDDPSTLYAEVNKPKKQKLNEALYSQPDKTKKPKKGDNKKENNKNGDTDTAGPTEALYAQPDKTKKKNKNSDNNKTAEPNAVPDLLYAQPDMSKKKKKKPEPPKKPKDTGKNKGKAEYVNAPSHPETAEGEYANVDVKKKKKKKKLPSDDGENPYQNVELQDEGENPYQNVEDITEENAKKKNVGPDGTVYADLDFEKKRKMPKKSEIIRTDPATEYAAIDFKRKPEDATEQV